MPGEVEGSSKGDVPASALGGWMGNPLRWGLVEEKQIESRPELAFSTDTSKQW